MPQEELDFQLSPSLSAKNADGVLEGMAAETRIAQSAPVIEFLADIKYGKRPRQKIDVYKPVEKSARLPCLVFVHGGFWQEGDKSVSGFGASTFTQKGWIYAGLGYTLTPEVTLTQLTEEIAAGVNFVHQNAQDLGIDPTQIYLAGHSAGAHLVACLLVDALTCDVSAKIAGAVLISGVYDLEPIAGSYVSKRSPIAPAEILQLSPLRGVPRKDRLVHVIVGADETQAFQIHSRLLVKAWQPYLRDLSLHVLPDRDHFDVLHTLSDPKSDTVARVVSWPALLQRVPRCET